MATDNGTNGNNSPKLHICDVIWSGDELRITSPKGGTVTVSRKALKKVDATLEFNLTKHFDDEVAKLGLTRDQLVKLAQVAGLKPADKVETPTVVATPAPVVAPVKPVVSAKVDKASTQDVAEVALEGGSKRGMVGKTFDQESKLKDQQRVIDRLIQGGGLYKLNYYIPAELSIKDSTGKIRIPNPSAAFHSLAVHLDGSNWLFTAKDLESEEVCDFRKLVERYKDFVGKEHRGPRCWVEPQRDDYVATLIEQCREMLAVRVRAVHTTLIESINSADKQLAEAETEFAEMVEEGEEVTDKMVKVRQDYRNNTVRSLLRRTGETLNDAIAHAERYDLTEDLTDLFAALRSALRAEVTDFNKIAKKSGVKLAEVTV